MATISPMTAICGIKQGSRELKQGQGKIHRQTGRQTERNRKISKRMCNSEADNPYAMWIRITNADSK